MSAVTGATCAAVAASLRGSVPGETLDRDRDRERPGAVALGHPNGTLTVGVGLDGDGVIHAALDRTVRRLASG